MMTRKLWLWMVGLWMFAGTALSQPDAHVVQPRETWYGIARMHNVAVESLQSLNPAVMSNGLQPGDILRLPQPATLPEIAPVAQVTTALVLDTTPAVLPELTAADTLKVLAILPFQFDADTLMGGMEDPRVVRLRQIAFEFYAGMRWAAQDLAAAGMDVSLRVVDAAPDSLGQMWNLSDVLWSDVVLGPLRRNVLDSALDVTALVGKPHWLLTTGPEDALDRGEHVFVAQPDESAAAHLLGRTAAELYGEQGVTLLFTGLKDFELEQAFIAGYQSAQDSLDLDLRQHQVTPRFAEGVAQMLDTTRTHIFAVPSGKSSRAMIAHLQNELLKADTISTRLLMHPDARDFEFLEPRLMEHTQLVVPSSETMDWTDSLKLDRLWTFREDMESDPSPYAFLAFDAVMESASWCSDFPGPTLKPIARSFDWHSAGSGRGWTNRAWHVEQFRQGWWAELVKPQAYPMAKAPSTNPNR